ncbi:MAG: glycosyltransferase family 2 protein [Candidatus Shapirobacteria bacterium]|jgi:cellulose synthase/poly-beta-1,6-N-acetylglucosamine synthase-like glycosyltransferase
MATSRPKISVLIPCYNEGKSIRACVQSCLDQTRPFDQILVVNDGSTDNSASALKKFGSKIQVITFDKPSGNKSFCQEKGLKYITGDIFVATDGDTILDKNFVELIKNDFENENVAAVAGYVRSIRYNWLTMCRAFDYVIGQNIHKLAQKYLGYIFVIPGAASAFRTEIFREYINFDHDTITEDLDFTYKLHKNNLKIAYDKKAIVYTQDPDTLRSYIGQMRRWYGGGWQNLVKHLNQDVTENPRIVLELSLIYIEGLVFSILIFIVPLINILLAIKFFFYLSIVVFIESIYASFVDRRSDLLLVVFVYPFMMYINSFVSLEQFIKEVVLKRRNLVWYHPARREI